MESITPLFLSKEVPWFGQHTGYQQLPRYMQEIVPRSRVISPRRAMRDRMVGKVYSVYRKWPPRNQYDAAAEFRFARANGVPNPIRHILHLEEHVWFLDRWTKAPRNIIGTLHLPPAIWPEDEIEYLKRLSSAIVLYRRDLDFFESIIGAGRVRVILHGVDVDFFKPSTAPCDPNQIVYTGHYLRNTAMLQRVIARLAHERPNLQFHLLVPEEFRHLPGFAELRDHSSVTWHSRLPDEELRNLVSRSWISLLPMNDSGANNSVVESLACGTPVVTTDVGGIRDYGGEEVFPVVQNNDDDAMLELIKRYLDREQWRYQVAAQCREFAVANLAWPNIARSHMAAYEELVEGP